MRYSPTQLKAIEAANGKVVPFPIWAQRGLLDDLRREANVARDPALRERCLRRRVQVYGQILADRGVARDLIEAEMDSMELALLGTISRHHNKRRKTTQRKRAA